MGTDRNWYITPMCDCTSCAVRGVIGVFGRKTKQLKTFISKYEAKIYSVEAACVQKRDKRNLLSSSLKLSLEGNLVSF